MSPPNAYDASSIGDMARALAEPPAHLPPLPPGSRYAGRLKDHDGRVDGWAFAEGSSGWERNKWYGMADEPRGLTADWHVALPADVKPIGEATTRRDGYAEDLERLTKELADMGKLLAQYSAEREHNAMMAGAYKAERDLFAENLKVIASLNPGSKRVQARWGSISSSVQVLLSNLTP